MGKEHVRVETSQSVATVTVDRPARRNAMDIETRIELREAFEELRNRDDVRVVVLRGAGDSFIAGGDIQQFSEMNLIEGMEYLHEHAGGLYDYIADFPTPVIAAIDGPALGGGLEISLACDIRIATNDATFGLPEVTLGLIPAAGGTQRLPKIVGVGAAKELILTGRIIDADEAKELNLVNRVVQCDHFEDELEEVAEEISSRAPLALQFAKRSINIAADNPAGLAFERMAGTALWGTDDLHEGVNAFLDGRNPDFSGE